MIIYDFQLVFIFVQGFFISNTNWLNFYEKMKMKINKYGKQTYNLH